MQNTWKYEYSTGKLYDVLSMCIHAHNRYYASSNICDLSLTLIYGFSLTFAEFPNISTFREIPEKW